MTAPCERFEQEFLLRLEEGLPLDPHVETCPECRKLSASYQKIRLELQRDRREEPRPGWEQRVFAALDAPPVATVQRPRRRQRWMAAGIAACAAALCIVVWRAPLSESQLTLTTAVIRGEGAPLRGGAAQPGDRLQMSASLPGARYAELRVYRDDRELVLRCAPSALPQSAQGTLSCARSGDILRAELRLAAIGAYQAYATTSDSPLPPPAPTLAEDSARLLAAGARIALGPAVRVY
jgi:hypothetical protein